LLSAQLEMLRQKEKPGINAGLEQFFEI